MFKRVLTVCVGNICRSPAAACLLHDKLSDKGFTISSAGLAAVVGKPMDKTAHQVLEQHGYQWQQHIAQQLEHHHIANNDIILAMEQQHIDSILAIAPEARGKVFLLGKWIENQEVPDPYKHSVTMHEHVFTLIDSATDRWLKYLI